MVRTKHRIGRYRVIAPIGAGGFSTVYRALDEENNLEVAIKVLAENHSMVPDTRRRFVDEFNLRSTVSSPFIAKMYEVGVVEETGQPYMVLELASRGDLRRRVEEIRRSHQVLNRADIMMLARHLTEALTALHSADIVHRDVSPGNILIRSRPSSGARQGSLERGNVTLLEPGERFLLADLGHAKDLIRSSGFTAGGGTRGFAAPEQLDDVTVVDHRADIFSATAIIEWAAHDGIHADALEPFCDIGLAEEPDERFASMAAWYDGISAALGQDREAPGRVRRRGRQRRITKAANDRSASNPIASQASGPGASGGSVDAEPSTTTTDTRRWPRQAAIALFCLVAVVVPVAIGAIVFDRRSSDEPTDAGPTDLAALDLAEAPADSNPTIPTPDPGVAAASSTTGPLVVQPNELPSQGLWASLSSPLDLTTIVGDLVIEGAAHGVSPTTAVEVTIQHQASGAFWTPAGPSAGSQALPVGLDEATPDDPMVRPFLLIIPAGELEPGDYLVTLSARGPDIDAAAEPIIRTVTLP